MAVELMKVVWKNSNFCFSFSQLVIKNLVDSTLKSGRMVDENSVPLEQFFVIINMVFKHGFKAGIYHFAK